MGTVLTVFARGGREGVFVLMLVVLVELYLLDDLIEKIVEKLVRVLVLDATEEFVSIAKLVDKGTRRNDALICLMSGNVYVERAEGREEGRRPGGDDEGWGSGGGGDIRGDLSALCFATGEDRGSGQQRWLCLSRYGGGYGWCGDVGRLDDKVAEGGAKVERLEHRVGVTVCVDMRRWDEIYIESAKETHQVFPNFTGVSWKGKRQRRGEWGDRDANHARFRNQTASHRRWRRSTGRYRRRQMRTRAFVGR